ncbi:hypothetical protein BCA37_26885 [Mycobacterium sp. djl-10]|nr:hypothetical protein BCA37_26885 [Mycobacterium sp. djl-10]
MADYPSLTHIAIADLLQRGDPWQIDETLQSGDPGEIAQLASAFQNAGGCTEETWTEWVQAKQRFEESWNGEGGVHPIADSEEVERATTQLFVQKDQLPLIAVDLQNIAADLAEAEKQSGAKLAELNGQLALLDSWVGQRIADDEEWSDLLDEARELTGAAFVEVERIRDQFTDKLEATAFDLRKNYGYDPAGIEDVDGDGVVSPEERGRTAPEHYDTNQRAKDEALVNSPGTWTLEKADALARLNDFATATAPPDAPVSPEQRELAQQRLDDFRMANFAGPLPRDPLLGGDARTRAQARLELQRQLEQGSLGFPPMDRDAATQLMNQGESLARVTTTREAYQALTAAGMSGEGATQVLSDVMDAANPGIASARAYAEGIPQGKHALPVDLLSASDAEVLKSITRKAGAVGDVLGLGLAGWDYVNDPQNPHRNEELGGALGSFVVGAGGTAGGLLLAGSFTNPVTAAIAVGVIAYASSEAGDYVGGRIGSAFDTPRPTSGG